MAFEISIATILACSRLGTTLLDEENLKLGLRIFNSEPVVGAPHIFLTAKCCLSSPRNSFVRMMNSTNIKFERNATKWNHE